MKIVFGTFKTHEDVENCILKLQSTLNVSANEVSYVYRNPEGKIENNSARVDEIVEGTATGATVGAAIGAAAGIATVAGIIPFIGPVFAAGPLVAALGLGAGAAATTATGAVTGALAGGLVGTLVEWGVPSDVATDYQDRLNAGESLLIVSTEKPDEVERIYVACNATAITVQSAIML